MSKTPLYSFSYIFLVASADLHLEILPSVHPQHVQNLGCHLILNSLTKKKNQSKNGSKYWSPLTSLM